MSLNSRLHQPVVHSRMARYNPYEGLPPEPPAVRYHHIPEPNYLIQPEFPPLDAGIQQPENTSYTFYQEPFPEASNDQQTIFEHSPRYSHEDTCSSIHQNERQRSSDVDRNKRSPRRVDYTDSDSERSEVTKSPSPRHNQSHDLSDNSSPRPHDYKQTKYKTSRRIRRFDDYQESSPRRQKTMSPRQQRDSDQMSPDRPRKSNSKLKKSSRKHADDNSDEQSSPRRHRDDSPDHHRNKKSLKQRADNHSKNSSPRRHKEESKQRLSPPTDSNDVTDEGSTGSPRPIYNDKRDHASQSRNNPNSEDERTGSSQQSSPRVQYAHDDYSDASFQSYSEAESINSRQSTPLNRIEVREADNGKKSKISENHGKYASEYQRNGDYSEDSEFSELSTSTSPTDEDQKAVEDKKQSDSQPRIKTKTPMDEESSDSDSEDSDNSVKKQTRKSGNEIKICNESLEEDEKKPDKGITVVEKRKPSPRQPQDLYSEIRWEMLKSYKDLNRKTAKNMPEKVENLTDDQLLLLYEFHRKRLLFQRRQEASVKAKVIVNETFLENEIRRLKKQQQDAKKKMRKILDDAFPSTKTN